MAENDREAGREQPDTFLLDANVLMSRVQRDYFLYAEQQGLINVRWSPAILQEMNRNLVGKRGMPQEGADRLEQAMTKHFPRALVEPQTKHFSSFADVQMPDPDDRHVLAAAVAADAAFLCTNNIKDFPDQAMARTGVQRVQPDTALTRLIADAPDAMRRAHQTTVQNNARLTDETTLDALRKSGAPRAADQMAKLLGSATPDPSVAEAQRLAGLTFAKPPTEITRTAGQKRPAPSTDRTTAVRNRPGQDTGPDR